MNFLKRYKMKFLSLMLALLFCGVVANAQVPSQTKGYFGQGQNRYDITLDQPTVAGQAIFVYVYAAGAQWLPGPVCALANSVSWFCNYNLFDSQGNQFNVVDKDIPTFTYIPASRGGPETITLIFARTQLENLSIVVVVFPDTLVLQDVVPARCDFPYWTYPNGTMQNICFPYSNGSFNGTDDSATLTSLPLTSSVPNELFFAIGDICNTCGGSKLAGTNGWADPIFGGELFMSYKTDAVVGTQEVVTMTATPPLLEGKYDYVAIQGFKVIPIQ
jgi:hypothetical protein